MPTIKSFLNNNTLNWLLEKDDPCIRYLTLRDITDADEKTIKAARKTAHKEGPIAKILSEMHPDGYWLTPGRIYANKCKGTSWSVILLAQLGASVGEDKRVSTACKYILDNALAEEGQISSTSSPDSTFDCLQGNLLTSLMDMGCTDSRIYTAYEWMARSITGEGLTSTGNNSLSYSYYKYKTGPGYACKSNKGRPCAWGGAKVMTAFSRLPADRRTDIIKRAIDHGIEYFLSVDPSTAAFPYDNPLNPDNRWWKFGFPLFWVTDILQVAEFLTLLGSGKDLRLAKTMQIITEKQNTDGRWLLDLDQCRNRMWQNYGSKGKPSKWVTLRALKVFKNLYT